MNDKQIKALNMVIETAVEHGGDIGGAYCCCPDELAEAMDNLVESLGDDYYWEWDDPKYEEIPVVHRK